MDFKFFPNSYNFKLMNEKGISKEMFLKLQIKYKTDFEKILTKIVNFKKVDEYIDSFGHNIPIVEDFEYNFYHKYSVLGSKYIFLRNNIHIENLTLEEINKINICLQNKIDLDANFLLSTYKKVIYEEGDISMFGLPTAENRVPAKSLVLEFAYDKKQFKNMSQIDFVSQIKNIIYTQLKKDITKILETEVFIINYSAIPDIYIHKT